MADQQSPPPPPPPIPGRIIDDIEALIVAVEEARPVPLSSNVMIPRDEFIDQLRDLQEALPEELRAARWMVRQRETYIARTTDSSDRTLGVDSMSEKPLSRSLRV